MRVVFYKKKSDAFYESELTISGKLINTITLKMIRGIKDLMSLKEESKNFLTLKQFLESTNVPEIRQTTIEYKLLMLLNYPEKIWVDVYSVENDL